MLHSCGPLELERFPSFPIGKMHINGYATGEHWSKPAFRFPHDMKNCFVVECFHFYEFTVRSGPFRKKIQRKGPDFNVCKR